ncbi:MAG TPA: cysteine-rich CWC family protein [Casimicrobiaceae bacterium]|nr:cysteine-rich CWC family protein [Casimicrobiaceae bacterium]
MTAQASREPRCPLCARPNECGPACTGSLDTPCWCTAVAIDAAILHAIPEVLRDRACLCVRCATAGTRRGSSTT